VIVRHLVMPGLLEDTGEIMRWLACELSPDIYVNVMDQYYPAWKAKTEAKFSDINREIRESEFEQALAPSAAQLRVRRDSPGGLKLVGKLIKPQLNLGWLLSAPTFSQPAMAKTT
jgi:hypothetical protein